jgi:hypothetical protein
MKIKDREEYYKALRKYHRKKGYKNISKSPENGLTLDVVDMMERNRERFQFGTDLNV